MLTAIVSDLHLGTTTDADLVRRPDVQERLFAAVAGADRVVMLGDLLELRERPAHAVLELARPFLAGLGEATASRQLVIVPGNHDHELATPALERARLRGGGPLPLEATFGAADGELMRQVCAAMPATEVVLAYPGVRLRDDVYATHGHYLDLHLTVPRLECIVASAVARFTVAPGDGGSRTPDSYDAALAPVYAFAHSVVQGAPAQVVTRGGSVSRAVWSRSNPGGRRDPAGIALGRVAIPAAVAALNALGLGPFRADITAIELRRAGLRAMAETVRALGIEAEHVVFGHTHRAGPLEGDVEGWWLPGGTRLTNTGSWLHEPAFLNHAGEESPYWPGRVTYLRDSGPPVQESLLGDLDLALGGVGAA